MDKNLLNIQIIKDYIVSNIKLTINNGKIIEFYEDDYPFASCLILG
ncbi:MAG: DUF4258 domain-containing protein [Clostridia bacterium]